MFIIAFLCTYIDTQMTVQRGGSAELRGKQKARAPPQSLPDHLRKLPILVLTISLASLINSDHVPISATKCYKKLGTSP